ncbi:MULTISPECIES: hypothetical protein [unclassified Nostoc]|uniref:hypothetical protein n=1 Tax=unclassified Nostoc TaxID=2593658 RepID=UPI0025AA8FFF|nr:MULTISPECIES: hypothetical protein [unclassified Nostoc]MDM9585308.1 hypothetical protein [Nostoc sp. GT001]MDZ7949300.1 hypothetical protein [Nostoc sp. EfeVER01]MDZ7993492.1 hypothetical protein [Nostoc sp. EspVER01]
MASIKISELRPAGSELFQDSESFLQELGAQEMGITGGATAAITLTLINNSVIVRTIIGNTANANTFGNVNTVVGQ